MTEPPHMIRLHDNAGHQIDIPRESFRTSVLPNTLQKAWNNPGALHDVLYDALTKGFRQELLDAAKHLYALDPTSSGACLYSLVLRDTGSLDQAESVLKECLAKTGGDSYIHSNLYKVYLAKKKPQLAEVALWHALELDPNQSDAFGIYTTQQKQSGGPLAYHAALTRIATLPKSWRASIWLGKEALDANNLPAAIAYFQQALAAAPSPTPTELLMQMSGDLGLHNHLPELLSLTTPHFDPKFHGITVGNNLIKANLDSHCLDAATTILNQLLAMNRPDWKETLTYWQQEIAAARKTGHS